MKKGLIIFGAIIGTILFPFLYILLMPIQHSTTDINDYGNYKWNNNNEPPREFITSFFPEEIEDCFTDVVYSYRVMSIDKYSCEAYLEFVIEDEDYYQFFVKEHTNGIKGNTFEYDNNFTEYTVDNLLELHEFPEEEEYHSKVILNHTRFGKILCSDEDNRIIFVAIILDEGGEVSADYLCKFFERFDIYPPDIATEIY